MHNMNWDDLRFFLAVCRKGSVTGAGKALGVNHTTVAGIGTRLFNHSRGGYEMTQAAENMYERAMQMEEITQAIDRDVFGQDAELKGPLKLTVSHDVAERLLIHRLCVFRNAYPKIQLDLLTTKGLVDLRPCRTRGRYRAAPDGQATGLSRRSRGAAYATWHLRIAWGFR